MVWKKRLIMLGAGLAVAGSVALATNPALADTGGTATSRAVAPAAIACSSRTSPSATPFPSWSQQVIGSALCRLHDRVFSVIAGVAVTTHAGFAGSHVTGCAMHFRVTRNSTVFMDGTQDCTAPAKRAGAGAHWSYPFVAQTIIPPGPVRVCGWMNIQTSVHYEGSRVPACYTTTV
jgi:hypothetical protein